MNDNLPPSLRRFAGELEQAIRRQLGPRRDHHLGCGLRARPRLLAGTTVGAAGTAAALALVLSAAGSSPAFAVTRRRDGSYSVTLRAVSAIPAANAKLARMGVRVRLIQVRANCTGPASQAQSVATSPPGAFPPGAPNTVVIRRAWTRAQNVTGPRARSNQVRHWRHVAVPVCGPPPPAGCGQRAQSVTAPPGGGNPVGGNSAKQKAISVKAASCTNRVHRASGGGNSGNSGNGGSGNSGNS